MIAKEPLHFARSLLVHFNAVAESSPEAAPEATQRIAALEGLIEAFKDIPSGVLDRMARIVVREHPRCDAVLRKFAAHVQHRDDGIGDLLVVACAVVRDAGTRNEMCALYRTTVTLAMEARSKGNFIYDGMGHEAARILGISEAPAAAA